MTRAALLAALLAGLAAAAPASAARYAVGLAGGASAEEVAARVAARTGGRVSHELAPIPALTLVARDAAGVAAIPGVEYVERLDATRRLAFVPSDPLVARQWHLPYTRAFDAWAERPPLAGPLVAVVDSGIDASHPEFKDRIADGRSFVGGDWRTDAAGHGTFVSGLIAAAHDDKGIAGIAFPSQLLVAKVVGPDRSIPLEAEVKAIRWAVERGARVINLSLGGVRDPLDPANDTFSQLEADAIDYAYGKGAVLVAAVGNADQAPRMPWPFASYPAALPHVVGVSALDRDGSVPVFSDRDKIYNDIAAPGVDLYSSLPLKDSTRTGCQNAGYSDCGPEEFRRAEGTSFAAPQVAAAAALLLAVRPELTPDQVMHLLTRTAQDANASTGCRECPLQRDALSGWGRLDVAAAVTQAASGKLPRADRLETNDEAGPRAKRLWGGRGGTLAATIDFWDDQVDVYRVHLRPRQRLDVALTGPGGTKVYLWRPETKRVEGLAAGAQRNRLAQSRTRGSLERFRYRAPARRAGWYHLQVKISKPGAGPYTLSYTKR